MSAAKRVLGSKRKVQKVNSKSRGVKIKLKIKAKSPEGMASAVSKMAKGISGG